jgi:hypothetical protein
MQMYVYTILIGLVDSGGTDYFSTHYVIRLHPTPEQKITQNETAWSILHFSAKQITVRKPGELASSGPRLYFAVSLLGLRRIKW